MSYKDGDKVLRCYSHIKRALVQWLLNIVNFHLLLLIYSLTCQDVSPTKRRWAGGGQDSVMIHVSVYFFLSFIGVSKNELYIHR